MASWKHLERLESKIMNIFLTQFCTFSCILAPEGLDISSKGVKTTEEEKINF